MDSQPLTAAAVDQVWDALAAHVRPSEPVTIAVNDSLGHVLAYDARAAFDFPVLGVAVRLDLKGGNGSVEKADVILNALGPAPIRAVEAEQALVGTDGGDEARRAAADLASRSAKPLDNTDHMPSWRKKMIKVYVRRALEALVP